MRVVVTGGNGKAGRHVVPHLIDLGYEVLDLDTITGREPTRPFLTR